MYPLQDQPENDPVCSPAPVDFPSLPANPTIVETRMAILNVVERMPGATASLMVACQTGCDRVNSEDGGLERLVVICEVLQVFGGIGRWDHVKGILEMQGWHST